MPLRPGLSAAVELVVTDDDTALALKTGDVWDVLRGDRPVQVGHDALFVRQRVSGAVRVADGQHRLAERQRVRVAERGHR